MPVCEERQYGINDPKSGLEKSQSDGIEFFNSLMGGCVLVKKKRYTSIRGTL